MTGFTAG